MITPPYSDSLLPLNCPLSWCGQNADVSSQDEDGRVNGVVYPLLSRNSDLSGVAISGLDASLASGQQLGVHWDYSRCVESDSDDASSSTVASEIFSLDNAIPDLEDSYGAHYEPVCPVSALCSVDTDRRSILCTCPDGSVSQFVCHLR